MIDTIFHKLSSFIYFVISISILLAFKILGAICFINLQCSSTTLCSLKSFIVFLQPLHISNIGQVKQDLFIDIKFISFLRGVKNSPFISLLKSIDLSLSSAKAPQE